MSNEIPEKPAEKAVQKNIKTPPGNVKIFLGSSPHIASPLSERRIMAYVLISLAPVSVSGIILFGIPALLTIVTALAAAETGEFVFRKLIKKPVRNGDLSAAVTGLLLALTLPPQTPLWMTFLGSLFAIIVAKEFFGGLGANVFNPALAGRAFLLMSFPAALTTWALPNISGTVFNSLSGMDALSTATPLAVLDMSASYGSNYSEMLKALLMGTHSGCIGETSILMIAAGFVFLLILRVVDWKAPLAMLGSMALLSFCFGNDPLLAILTGGAVFGAFFMATDYVTSPFGSTGKFIFGCGAGIITVLIRQWGAYPEGVTYGILIMNAVVPFLDRILPKKYGYVKPKKQGEA